MSLVIFIIDLILAIATAVSSLAMAIEGEWMIAWVLAIVCALAGLNAGALSIEM